jgi:hypothetical protein
VDVIVGEINKIMSASGEAATAKETVPPAK